MPSILYFCPNGIIYETSAHTRADIAKLVGNHTLESLTSADHQFDFWFTPSTLQCHRVASRTATEMLLATTRFSAKTVPLLRGGVVVASHDSEGALQGLTRRQMDLLSLRNQQLPRREQWVLGRRIARDRRDERRNLATLTTISASGRYRPDQSPGHCR